jgi:hypothetical protein
MDKKEIKILVRESLSGLFEKSKNSVSKDEDKEKDSKKQDDAEEKETKKSDSKPLDQSSIQNALKDDMAPTHISVCAKALGYNPNDAGDRAKCVQKIEKRHGQRLLKKELDDIEGALGLK